MSLARTLIPVSMALALAPALARADTFVVDPSGAGDFLSVSDALLSPAVVAGDRVLVLAGTYVGTYDVDRALSIEAVGGAAATTLDGGGASPVVTLSAGASLRGFTITGGDGPTKAGGVHVTSSAPVWIEDCVIRDNHPTGDIPIPAGGVLVDTGAKAWIARSVIEENTSLSAGGLTTGPSAECHLIACKVRGNGGPGTITGGMVWGASGRIVDCEITGNWGSGTGAIFFAGGAPFPEGATFAILSSAIVANHGDSPLGSAGGIVLDDGGAVTITNTILKDNAGSILGDILASPDFFGPAPVLGTLDPSYSQVGFLGATVPPGLFMVPSFMAPGFAGPISDMDAPTTAGDFSLLASSPNVDAGDDAAHPLDVSDRDVAGKKRVLGAAIDVGANERGTSCDMPRAYGIGKVTSTGKRPYVSTTGEPSLSGSGLTVDLHDARAGVASILFRGTGRTYAPFLGGTLLLEPPVVRIGVALTDASGSTSRSIVLLPGLSGRTRCYQYWFRDPAHPDGSTVGVSNAVEVTFCD